MNKEQIVAIIQRGYFTDGDLADALLTELAKVSEPEAYMYHIKGNGKLTELAAIEYQEQFGETIIHKRALYSIPPQQPDLVAEIELLKADLENERMRLAACGVAALGYFDGCNDEYKSASLSDTLRLYAANNELRQQLSAAQADNEHLVKALEFYADGDHFIQHDPDKWDSVSGDPENFKEDECNTATVEDGTVAKQAIATHKARKEK